MDNEQIITDDVYVCAGCHRHIIVGQTRHAQGCMLRESPRMIERRRGQVQHLPGMKNVCPRCGELMNDKQIRHSMCPKRLPD